MNRIKALSPYVLLIIIVSSLPLYSQEQGTPEEAMLSEIVDTHKPIDNIHIFLNSLLLFPISSYDGGFGLGETITIQYRLPFKLNMGIEMGYYGFKSEADSDESSVVGGYSIIPFMAQASYDFRIVDNVYVTPVLKAGGAYTSAAINGWLGDTAFSAMFEGGVRLKGIVADGLLIQGNIMYTGIIEESGIFSLLSLGFGFGL